MSPVAERSYGFQVFYFVFRLGRRSFWLYRRLSPFRVSSDSAFGDRACYGEYGVCFLQTGDMFNVLCLLGRLNGRVLTHAVAQVFTQALTGCFLPV